MSCASVLLAKRRRRAAVPAARAERLARGIPVIGRGRPITAGGTPALLKRHFVVFLDLGRRARRGCLARSSVSAGAVLVALLVQHFHFARHDFLPRSLLAGLFIIPGIGADGSLDVDQTALAEVLPANLTQPVPRLDVVPLGALLLLAALVGKALVRRQSEFRD